MNKSSQRLIELHAGNKKWTMANGQRIRIRDMNNGHLLNTIRYLEHRAEVETGLYMAIGEYEYGFAVDAVFDGACVEDYFPIYNDLRIEANRRGFDLSMPGYQANRIATSDEFPYVDP